MMLSKLPSSRAGADRPQTPDLPLHARLFGERGPRFFMTAGLSVVAMAALLVFAVFYTPQHTPKALGLFALSLFTLISGSPSRRIQAVALGIMGGLIWSHLQVGPLLVAVAAVITAPANYVCAAVLNRDLPSLYGLTRRQRLPVLARIVGAVVVSWGSVTGPGALVVYRYLLAEGWRENTAGLLVLAGVGVLAVLVYRNLADEIPGAADG